MIRAFARTATAAPPALAGMAQNNSNMVRFWLSSFFKRLSKDTLDVRDRRAYEAEMIKRGMTPQQAGQAWFDAYFSGSSATARPGRRS